MLHNLKTAPGLAVAEKAKEEELSQEEKQEEKEKENKRWRVLAHRPLIASPWGEMGTALCLL